MSGVSAGGRRTMMGATLTGGSDNAGCGHEGLAERSLHVLHDASGGLAVPAARDAALRAGGERLLDGAVDGGGLGAGESVRALGDRHRTLGVGTERDAGDAEDGGLLL